MDDLKFILKQIMDHGREEWIKKVFPPRATSKAKLLRGLDRMSIELVEIFDCKNEAVKAIMRAHEAHKEQQRDLATLHDKYESMRAALRAEEDAHDATRRRAAKTLSGVAEIFSDAAVTKLPSGGLLGQGSYTKKPLTGFAAVGAEAVSPQRHTSRIKI